MIGKRLRALRRLRQEVEHRINLGMDPEQAGDEALEVVRGEFGASAVDWATLLPILLEFLLKFLELMKKPSVT